MTSFLGRCRSGIGPRATGAALLAAGAGLLALVLGVALGRSSRALGAVVGSWLFCLGLGAGTVAVSAAVRLSRGRWAEEILPRAEAGVAFLAPAWILLALLLGAARWWMPGWTGSGGGAVGLVARDLLAAAALWAAGRHYVAAARRQAQGTARAAIAYLLVYVVALSIFMVDLVMSLGPWAPSTVLPPFYFMGAFLGGLAWSALLAVARARSADPAAGSDLRNDLGKLLFAFSIFWAYLLWAAYLPTWYANLPEETGQLLARWRGGWRGPSLFAIVAVFGFPFCFLFPERHKRRPGMLALGAASILTGLFASHLVMVLPALAPVLDGPTLLCSAAGALVPGAFVLVTGARLGTEAASRRSQSGRAADPA